MPPAPLTPHWGSATMVFSQFFSCSFLPQDLCIFCCCCLPDSFSLITLDLSTHPPSLSQPLECSFQNISHMLISVIGLFTLLSMLRTGTLSIVFTVSAVKPCWAHSRFSGSMHEVSGINRIPWIERWFMRKRGTRRHLV